jgi:HSP20 family protein
MLSLWHTPGFDRVFDDVMKSALSGFGTTARFSPAVDIRSKDQEIEFNIDVPGVKQEDLDVTLENRVLSIKGARRFEAGENEKMSVGRAYGSFSLRYQLPEEADGEHVAAHLADGVLTLRIAKQRKAQPRKIAISAAPKQLE